MKQIKFNEMRENTEEGETRLYRISNNNNGSAHTHKKRKKIDCSTFTSCVEMLFVHVLYMQIKSKLIEFDLFSLIELFILKC